MINFFIPLDGDGGDRARQDIMRDFEVCLLYWIFHFYFDPGSSKYIAQDFRAHTGKWAHHYDAALPEAVSEDQHIKNNGNFTIGEVQDWVEKHGGIDGRLRWFEAYSPNNAFYQRIAKPLLSIRTAGSIDVERKVKPLKSKILTKSRNQSRDQKSQMLFRASENLRQLSKIKMEFKRQGIPLPSTLARSNDFATCTPVKTNIKAQGIKSSDSDTEEE